MHIDIIWYDLYLLNFVHAPLNAIWIIFEVRYDIFFLFYKIAWVIVRLVFTPDDKKKLKSGIIGRTVAQILTDAPH